MAKGKGRQRKRIRKRGWDVDRDVDSASREPRRIRGRESGIGAPVEVEKDFSGLFTDIEANGVVVSPYGLLTFVCVDGEERLCRVADDLTDGKTSVLAPGDRVRVELNAEEPVVCAVARRRTKLSRPAAHGEREQVFAANVDLIVVVASAAMPAFKPGLVDRFLIAADLGGVEPLLCINKMDLVKTEPHAAQAYRELGVPVIKASCVDGSGIPDVREALRDKVSVMGGQSGVGKSSLINALGPGTDIVTRDVSETTEKGRHTTASSRLYRLDANIQIIDTPGIRKLGIWGVSPEELGLYFPEMAALALQCRFRNCTHTHEPLCAVRAAVDSGEMTRRRYGSYVRIRESLDS